ncbi:glycosyltransferase [Vibrio brasiliensis]|mgnify:CR=1 FL=1|uniref:Group 1 glycosyl transferase n=1 Tax=Vibrio brasiliensis LMG 20546 TaxID=945543 RepID=E8M059_9VIBR|nr:glycosyltransferase [Vibrio brasiliensis]EGA63711.1 group 1 glycosyl transferase [Vibrio brasiliensis LMG 20546]
MSDKIVLMINSLTQGGAERIFVQLVNDFNSQGYKVTAAFLDEATFYKLPDSIETIYLVKGEKESGKVKKFFNLFKAAIRLRKYIKNNNISLVQSHLFRSNYINIIAKILGAGHKAHLVSAVSAKAKYPAGRFLSNLSRTMISFFYRRADLLIFKARAMEKEYINDFHLSNPSIVINNPINTNYVNKERLRTESAKFSFDISRKYIVSVGRFHPDKKQSDLVLAFSELNKTCRDYELIFLGDGPTKSEVEDLACEICAPGTVHFLGSVDNPFVYLNKASIYISTSISEGFPNALVEALCCEVPVISTDCMTGPREILAPGSGDIFLKDTIEVAEYGILVPINNVECLVDAICLLKNEGSDLYSVYKRKAPLRAQDFDSKVINIRYRNSLALGNQ